MSQARFNLYTISHCGIRYALAKFSQLAGAADYQANEELAILEKQMDLTLTFFRDHVEIESKLVHKLLEKHFPHELSNLERDQQFLLADLATLEALYSKIKRTPAADPQRNTLGQQFYMLVNKLHGNELQHMQYEEEIISEKLWSHYTDAELMQIPQEIVAVIVPQQLLKILSSVIPASNFDMLNQILIDLKKNTPPEFFKQVTDLAKLTLPKSRLRKISNIIITEERAVA